MSDIIDEVVDMADPDHGNLGDLEVMALIEGELNERVTAELSIPNKKKRRQTRKILKMLVDLISKPDVNHMWVYENVAFILEIARQTHKIRRDRLLRVLSPLQSDPLFDGLLQSLGKARKGAK